MLKALQRIGYKNYLSNYLLTSPALACRPRRVISFINQYSSINHRYYNTRVMQQPIISKPEGYKPQSATALIDLASGMPPPELLQTSAKHIAQAAGSLFSHINPLEILDYGNNPGPKSTLEQLSHFLSRRYRTGVQADWLFTVAGASHALHFLPSILGPLPGGRAFVEQPTYMHALDVFIKDFNYEIVPVETDRYGVVPDGLQKAFEKSLPAKDVAASIASNRYASILYLQTAFANPGGYSLPRERMVELEKIARQWNVLILADDVYSFTNFSELTDMSPGNLNSLPYLPSTSTEGSELSDHIITLGSASKVISPGLRFGWIVVSPRNFRTIDECGYILSGGCPNHYIAGLVGQLIADGSADILTDFVRNELKARFAIASGIFTAHLPGNVSYTMPRGGYFVWLKVPKSTARGADENSTPLVQHLRERFAVRVVDGSRCLLPEISQKSTHWAIRVSMTALPRESLLVALRTLADGICDYLCFKPTV